MDPFEEEETHSNLLWFKSPIPKVWSHSRTNFHQKIKERIVNNTKPKIMITLKKNKKMIKKIRTKNINYLFHFFRRILRLA